MVRRRLALAAALHKSTVRAQLLSVFRSELTFTAVDSYPGEFTQHHTPLLFVAGISPPAAAAPASPSPDAASETPPPPPELLSDAFEPLVSALRKTLVTRKGFAIYDNSRGVNHDFHVVLVDKVRCQG